MDPTTANLIGFLFYIGMIITYVITRNQYVLYVIIGFGIVGIINYLICGKTGQIGLC